MERIKPHVTSSGYNKALSEYGNEPNRIIEELVANSYDADATEVVVLYSEKYLAVIDNGTGISDTQFSKLLGLGAGTKIGTHDSRLKRSYLGAFGFGIKSTANISRQVDISTINSGKELCTSLDINLLNEHGFDEEFDGFEVQEQPNHGKKGETGVAVLLELKTDLTPDQTDAIKQSLYNLPKSRDFRMFFASFKKAGVTANSICAGTIRRVSQIAKALKKERISGELDIGEPEFVKCDLPGSDRIDVAVWCSGLDSNLKVQSLKALAGVYVKVDGRVLKRNFQGEKILDGVSKFPKFKHGMRIEVPIDWVKQQISLGRDGLQFGNEPSRRKFENELKTAVSAAVRPYAKQLETRKSRGVARELELRMKKGKERIREKQSIKRLEATGYSFVPKDDYEMALLIANPAVLKLINPKWQLIDFNGQLDFDCLVYDRGTADFVHVELEPQLERYISQSVNDNTEYVVTWTRGDWKVGKTKKGKKGHFQLLDDKERPGHYKLLIKSGPKSREPKKVLPVFCIDKALSLE